jgi:hypothetical protein
MKRLILISVLGLISIIGMSQGRLPYQTLIQSYRGDTLKTTIGSTYVESYNNLSGFSINNDLLVRDTTVVNLIKHYAYETDYWTKSGTSIYYNDGNVGVGITNPSAPLNVYHSGVGSNYIIKVDGTVVSGGFKGYGNGVAVESYGINVSAIKVGYSANAYQNYSAIVQSKVGIGTATPTNTLSLGSSSWQKFWVENSATDVVGRDLTVAAGSTIEGTSIDNVVGGCLILQAGLGTGNGTSNILFQTGTTGTTGKTLQPMETKMTILGSGNVGIGTTLPSYTLDVSGTVRSMSNFYVRGDTIPNFTEVKSLIHDSIPVLLNGSGTTVSGYSTNLGGTLTADATIIGGYELTLGTVASKLNGVYVKTDNGMTFTDYGGGGIEFNDVGGGGTYFYDRANGSISFNLGRNSGETSGGFAVIDGSDFNHNVGAGISLTSYHGDLLEKWSNLTLSPYVAKLEFKGIGNIYFHDTNMVIVDYRLAGSRRGLMYSEHYADYVDLSIPDFYTVKNTIHDSIGALITLTDLSSTATGLTYTNTTGVFSLTSGYAIGRTKVYQTLTSSASIAMDVSSGINAELTLGHNATLTLSNLTSGDEGNIIITQDATGSRTITISPTPKVINGGSGVVTLSTAANSVDILSYTYDGTTLFITYGKNYN